VIDDTIHDFDMVNIVFRGITKSWEHFVEGICPRDIVPNFNRIWIDCIQEDTLLESRYGFKRIHDEEFSLSSQERKGNIKNISSGELTTRDGKKKKDMIKLKLFSCHKFVNYVGKFPYNNKYGNKMKSKLFASIKAQFTSFARSLNKESSY